MKDYWVAGKSAYTVDISRPEVQDWYISRMLAFMEKTGAGGWAWDHDIFAGPRSSRYGQWRGWMRILNTLRAAHPNMVMDHRQTAHAWGPWYVRLCACMHVCVRACVRACVLAYSAITFLFQLEDTCLMIICSSASSRCGVARSNSNFHDGTRALLNSKVPTCWIVRRTYCRGREPRNLRRPDCFVAH